MQLDLGKGYEMGEALRDWSLIEIHDAAQGIRAKTGNAKTRVPVVYILYTFGYTQ